MTCGCPGNSSDRQSSGDNVDDNSDDSQQQPLASKYLGHEVGQLSYSPTTKLKSHSHDGTPTRNRSVKYDTGSAYSLARRPTTQDVRLYAAQSYHQSHVANDSPDLLNSRQLRRQVARYGSSVSFPLDEEQLVAYNGGDYSNSSHMRSSAFMEETRTDEDKLTVLESLKNAAQASWLHVLVVFIPLGYVAHYMHWPVVAVFILNFFAIIPLSALMGFATEEVSLRFGPTWGGVFNAVFGNAVEFIVAVIALVQEEYRIVQAGLIGSVLSNTLLLLGCSFLAGGLRHRVQFYRTEAAQCAGALLALSVLSMIVPAAYHGVHAPGGQITNGILIMSRGTALILLIVYILFLIFQLKTHSDIFEGPHASSGNPTHDQAAAHELVEEYYARERRDTDQRTYTVANTSTNLGPSIRKGREIESTSGTVLVAKSSTPYRENHSRRSAPKMMTWVAVPMLVIIAGLVAFSSYILVESVEELTTHYSISHTFVGMILLPIAASAAEHTMSITVALRNKMDLCITVAVGSSMQMTLFVLPVLIIIAWILNRPLTLFFDDFETTTMLISVLVINYLIMNGRSNWLKGAMLLNRQVV
ncbi:hypothetical protein GGI07_000976 [Coemansia sp. Benny D115]|nr:hypothetical protein GGI07_000976 [Coemansia sp. Benny D115]